MIHYNSLIETREERAKMRMCDVSGSVICCPNTYFATCKQLSFVRKYKVHEFKEFDKGLHVYIYISDVYYITYTYILQTIICFLFYLLHYIYIALKNLDE